VFKAIYFQEFCVKYNLMLQTTYPIQAQQVADFQRDGHIYLSGLMPKNSLNPYRDAIVEWADEFRRMQKPMEERDTYGKAFLQMMNLWEENAKIKEFVLAKRFGQIAADLLGVKQVRLYHDQALFKEAGGGHTPWHQDQYYWPLSTPKTVTMWMPLVDITEEMGMLTFASGTQGVKLPPMPISDESEATIASYVRDQGFPIVAQKTMQAGDATFHMGWTLHAAPGNHAAVMREVMTVIFMDADIEVCEPQNENQEADRKRWLASKEPGTRADSWLNPIIN
jgi:ectoine hydroxylase-related dioxygenase (phytanoyl-CoA dioxygenase family)